MDLALAQKETCRELMVWTTHIYSDAPPYRPEKGSFVFLQAMTHIEQARFEESQFLVSMCLVTGARNIADPKGDWQQIKLGNFKGVQGVMSGAQLLKAFVNFEQSMIRMPQHTIAERHFFDIFNKDSLHVQKPTIPTGRERNTAPLTLAA